MKTLLTVGLTVALIISTLIVAVMGLYGDLSSDDKIDARDAVKLAQHLAGWNVELSEQEKANADVYYDGVINAKDAVKLAQYLAGWDVYLGPKEDGGDGDGDDVLWGDNEEDIGDRHKVREDIFAADRGHLNPKGYAMFMDVVRELLDEYL